MRSLIRAISGCGAELSTVVARASARSRMASRMFCHPSLVMDAEITRAAAASAHHQPIPIPATPAAVASPVSQSARFISASARRTLSWSCSASRRLILPRMTGATQLARATAIISHP